MTAAFDNPIEGCVPYMPFLELFCSKRGVRFVLDDMRIESITDRVREVLEMDYYSIAKNLLDERMSGKETGPVSYTPLSSYSVLTTST